MKIQVINGPNLNMLGKRDPDQYGSYTLGEIEKMTTEFFSKQASSPNLDWFQSQEEGEIIKKIHTLSESNDLDGIVINPGGLSHTSVSLLDALSLLKIPVIEVHLSKISNRENFRQNKITAQAARIVIEGAKEFAYILGIQAIILMENN